MRRLTEVVSFRAALAIALGSAWLNFLLTSKWAAYPGALNGWKRPWYALALIVASAFLAAAPARPRSVRLRGLSILAVSGAVLLTAIFFRVFPPHTWTLLPFDDDWVPRFQTTRDGVALLRRGAVVGWQWAFLGGYQTSADMSQSLTMVGALPMWLFGDRIGFHLLHLLMMIAIPVMVWRDIASDGRRDIALLAAFLAFICAAGLFGTIIPSGDTNSIAGVFSAMVALTGSRLTRQGHRYGALALVGGLTLALYSHLAFFGYAVVYLCLEAFFYRDRRMAFRLAVAIVAAAVASLPQFIELVRYRDFFLTNNIVYGASSVDPWRVAREIFYNTEILVHPHRWFNDYLSLTKVYLAVFVWVALCPGRSRARFHSWAVLATMVMLRFDVPEAGYLFARAMHMLAPLAAAPLAWFIIEQGRDRRLAWALVALVALYPQTNLAPVPHVASERQLPINVNRIDALGGARVLVENSPHRDLDSDLNRRTQKTPFGVHFEAYLPSATPGRLYYGQIWDCWHWTPFRGQVVAAGSFRGETIDKTGVEEFAAELRRWGVTDLLVWSTATRTYLDAAADRFTQDWRDLPWVHYRLKDGDPRSVVVDHGSGSLEGTGPLEGRVGLDAVRKDSLVVVRANYFPAWRAAANGTAVPLFSHEGQIAFRAPADGDYDVTLQYPRRVWLSILAVFGLIAGTFVVARACVIPSSPSAAA